MSWISSISKIKQAFNNRKWKSSNITNNNGFQSSFKNKDLGKLNFVNVGNEKQEQSNSKNLIPTKSIASRSKTIPKMGNLFSNFKNFSSYYSLFSNKQTQLKQQQFSMFSTDRRRSEFDRWTEKMTEKLEEKRKKLEEFQHVLGQKEMMEKQQKLAEKGRQLVEQIYETHQAVHKAREDAWKSKTVIQTPGNYDERKDSSMNTSNPDTYTYSDIFERRKAAVKVC